MSNITKAQLEEFIDRTSLAELLFTIADVCDGKSGYIRGRYEPSSADWTKASDRIIGLASGAAITKVSQF
jgi:hypothetical protein